MKKTLTFLLLGFLACFVWSCSSDDDTPVAPAELPATAQNFIKQYWPAATIVKAEQEPEKDGAFYDVWLSDGTEIEFTSAGEWISVDAPVAKAVPDGIVPQQILTYVADNCGALGVNEISKEVYGWKAELVTGLELHFSPTFEYMASTY